MFNLFKFLELIPPSAITFFLVLSARRLNFVEFKKFLHLLVLKIGDKKINSVPCFSLILISFIECAEPSIVNFCLIFVLLIFRLLLNEGR